MTCDVYCGTPILVGAQLDRKTATRLAEAATRKLAVMSAVEPCVAYFPRDRKAPTLGDTILEPMIVRFFCA